MKMFWVYGLGSFLLGVLPAWWLVLAQDELTLASNSRTTSVLRLRVIRLFCAGLSITLSSSPTVNRTATLFYPGADVYLHLVLIQVTKKSCCRQLGGYAMCNTTSYFYTLEHYHNPVTLFVRDNPMPGPLWSDAWSAKIRCLIRYDQMPARLKKWRDSSSRCLHEAWIL